MNSKLLFILLLPLVVWQGCPDGLYPDGEDCLPCDSSWLTCDGAGSWLSWKAYMKVGLNGLCEYCPEDEFWDFTLQTCQSCAGSWNGLCASRKECFECDPGEVLDLDSMIWVPTWNNDKILFQTGDEYNINEFCRGFEYYVDPHSDEIIELGTLKYPYRTIKPVFFEILYHHSHSDRNIAIYLAENSNIFIEDSTSFVLNITKVTITTYGGMATLWSTELPTENISKKANFHLLNQVHFNSSEIVEIGNFTEYELNSAGRDGDTFHIVRSSFEISNIVAKRVTENIRTGTFMYLLYLQNRDLIISKHTLIPFTTRNFLYYPVFASFNKIFHNVHITI